MPDTVISAESPILTFINVFSVEPANQQRLVELWQQATEHVMRHLPGFISANVHRSLDGTKGINYAQWETADAFNAALKDPDATAWFARLAQIGTLGPIACEVVSVHHR